MNITTTAQNFAADSAVDIFVRNELQNALARLDTDIIAVDVFMKDINGPKGGVDKQALIRVQLRNRHVVTTETEHENLFGAIKTGVKRTKRAVRRQLRKSRQINKQRAAQIAMRTPLPKVPWI